MLRIVASIANLLRGSEREFFDLFEPAGANIVRAADRPPGDPPAQLALDDIVDYTESLFEGGIDAMVVIRWKDIFERIENAIDSTQRAAFVLEGIVIKSA